ncbi:MAG: bacteriophage antitermination protein Q, partial [Acinetobacter sp.]
SGKDPYQYGDLAALLGVNKTNWSQNYVEHYDAMISLYRGLDSKALLHVSRSRSQQKAANCRQGIA